MPLEKVLKLFQPKSVEEHERIVDTQMLSLQLKYADRVFSGEIPVLGSERKSGKGFATLMLESSSILHYASKLLREKANYDNKEIRDTLGQIIMLEAYQIHRDHAPDWIDRIQKMIIDVTDEEAKKINEKINTRIKPQEDMKSEIGLLNYATNHDPEEITAMGLDPKDDYVSVHFEALYKQRAKGEVSLTIEESLEKLAVVILEQYPQTRAVIAHSWLVESHYAAALGLQNIKRDYSPNWTLSFWGQFLNKKGEINQERAAKFLETGVPEYYVSYGSVPIVDFLKKYLPQEKKGSVVLKEIRPGFYEKFQHDTKVIKDIQEEWDTITPEEIKTLVETCEVIGEFEQSGNGNQSGHIARMLCEWKDAKLSVQEMEHQFSTDEKIEEFKKWYEDYKYISKEYTI